MNTKELIQKSWSKLQEAYSLAISSKAPSRRHPTIEAIIGGNAKTYKYILITALAAKAAEEQVNPLCLQVAANKPGAYDARSVCHKCLVPFERRYLNNVLGGSNEPFLNKPARFSMLRKSNPTRGGKAKISQEQLIDFLSQVTSSKIAFEFLTQAISYVLTIKVAQKSLPFYFSSSASGDHAKVYLISSELLKKNNGGEILTLVVASLYEMYLHEIYDKYRVDSHNVNQSGSSSKQVSDIDLYLCEDLFLCNEIKDKEFSIEDVEHAVNKTKEAGCRKLNFIYGMRVTPNHQEVYKYQEKELETGFLLNVISIQNFLSTILSLTRNVDAHFFAHSLASIARMNNYSQDTMAYLAKVLSRFR